jgi:peptide/nickel transport system substrate-binding protein
MRRVLFAGLAAALLGLACGEDHPKTPASTAPSATGVAGKPGASPTGPKPGGYLVLPSPEPTVLNPILQAAFDEVTPLVFEGLIGLDAKLEPVPRLAEKWNASADGKVFTFTLRKNVVWHDGKPFTSADVKFTMDQIFSSDVPTNWKGYLAQVEKVDTPDPSTVVVTYKEPYGPALMTYTFGIIPKHLFEGKPLAEATANNAPVGTGPFKFVRWTPGRNIQLDAHEKWWAGRPFLDRVEAVFDTPPGKGLEALGSGKIDIVTVSDPNDLSGVLATPEFRERYEVSAADAATYFVLAWNCKRGPTRDKRVRVALAHAIDRARVIQDVLRGDGRPISGPFPAAMWGADPSIAPWPFDTGAAGKMLDEAGFKPKPDGKRFAMELILLEARRSAPYDQMMAIFRTDLATIGIDLKVTYLKPAEFVKRLTARNFDAAFYEWVPDIADPDPYVLLHSTQAQSGANYAGYANPAADKLLDEGHQKTDRNERRHVYAALHKIVHDEQPYAFLFSPREQWAWSRRVRGVNPIDIAPPARFPGIARWWVE